MRGDPRTHSKGGGFVSVATLIGIALAIELLSVCGGKTDESGKTYDSGSTRRWVGGLSQQCVGDTEQYIPGVGCVAHYPANQGGFGGQSGQVGKAGSGTDDPSRCVGDTEQYIPGMGCVVVNHPANQGGFGGQSGQAGKAGDRADAEAGMSSVDADAGMSPVDADAGMRVADATVEVGSDEASLMTMAAASTVGRQACYDLSGHNAIRCLPVDDSLLPWLSNVPTGCRAHLTSGPFAQFDDRRGRMCWLLPRV